MSPFSHKMPALNPLPLWGAIEDPAGSGVNRLRPQKVQLQLRCLGPQLALSNSLGLQFLPPNLRPKESEEPCSRWKVMVPACVRGAHWGTFMPYCF